MKFLSIVLIVVFLFMSCGTLSEGERIEETGIDDVKETEMTQEEFEGIFGKKQYYTSIDREDVEMTDLDPVVMEDEEVREEPVVVEEDVSLDIPLFAETESFVPESDFVFPGGIEESEWVDVPEIEVLEETEIIEQEDVSLPAPSDATELIVLYQSEEKSAEDESVLSDYESALEEQETVIEEESESLEAVSIEDEDDSFITIDEVLSGKEKVEPRRKSILMLLASKPLLSAIILAIVAFSSIGYIIMGIEKKRSFRDVEYDDSTTLEEDEESEEEPLSPSPDIIGVPVDDDKEKMDIREGEESYSALVEESLS
ncbi:MAG: hypothetical protein ACI4NB_08865 [Candidatus Ornithospirochaeta sp.]